MKEITAELVELVVFINGNYVAIPMTKSFAKETVENLSTTKDRNIWMHFFKTYFLDLSKVDGFYIRNVPKNEQLILLKKQTELLDKMTKSVDDNSESWKNE